jgi:hypothetical protein
VLALAGSLSVPAGSVVTDLESSERPGEEVNPMPAPIPGPGPDDQQPGPQPGRGFADGLPAGLDYQALLDAMAASGMPGCDEADADAQFADLEAAAAEGRLLPADPAQVARGERGAYAARPGAGGVAGRGRGRGGAAG